MRRLPALLLSIAILCAPSFAQVIFPIQHDRHVLGLLDPADPNEPNTQIRSAPDFGPWLAEVCVSSSSLPRSAGAGQNSVMTGTSIDAYGAADIAVTAQYDSRDYTSAAQNVCRFRFAVPEPASVNLVGQIAVEAETPWLGFAWWRLDLELSVQLNRIAGESVCSNITPIHIGSGYYGPGMIVEVPVFAAAELTPGIYELTIAANVSGVARDGDGWDPLVGQASYVIAADFFTTPDPGPTEGDLDGDGDVDMLDFARLQRAFTGPRAQ